MREVEANTQPLRGSVSLREILNVWVPAFAGMTGWVVQHPSCLGVKKTVIPSRASIVIPGEMTKFSAVRGTVRFCHGGHRFLARIEEKADPTLKLIGQSDWSRARLGFGARPVHPIIPSRDMLVPIAVLAETGDPAHPFEDRSSHYLIRGFAAAIPAAARSAEWPSWMTQIEAMSPRVMAAFEGRHNLHEDDDAIDRLRQTYEAMRKDRPDRFAVEIVP